MADDLSAWGAYILNLAMVMAAHGRWCVFIIPCSASAFQFNPILIPHPQQRGACTKQEWWDQSLKEYNQCSKQRGRIRGLILELHLAILTQNCNNVNKIFPRIRSAGFRANLERPALSGPSDWCPSKVLGLFFFFKVLKLIELTVRPGLDGTGSSHTGMFLLLVFSLTLPLAEVPFLFLCFEAGVSGCCACAWCWTPLAAVSRVINSYRCILIKPIYLEPKN